MHAFVRPQVQAGKKVIAEGGFDPPTFGLWAQHAPAAPLCWFLTDRNAPFKPKSANVALRQLTAADFGQCTYLIPPRKVWDVKN